jgi:lipoprotein-releasing system permease protein
MVISIAVVTGFKNEVSRKVYGFGSHIQITALTNNKTFEMPPIVVTDSTMASISNANNVAYAQKYAIKPAILKTSDNFKGTVLKGVNKHYNWNFFADNLQEGTLPAINDTTVCNDVIISKKTATDLQLKVGDKLLAYFIQNQVRVRQFVVSGIYETGLAEFDQLYIIGDIQHIQFLNGWNDNQVTGVEIAVNDLNTLEDTKEQLQQITSFTYQQLYQNPYYIRTAIELQPQIFNWLALLDMNIVVILALMMAVAGFTMISGLLILILEKTNMIGTLKALGASNWTIRKVFLYQATFLIGKGMLWGNVIGLLICLLQYYGKIIHLDPSIYFVDTVPIELSIWAWLLLNVGVAIITLCMMLLPSHIIAKISPAKAIKFD